LHLAGFNVEPGTLNFEPLNLEPLNLEPDTTMPFKPAFNSPLKPSTRDLWFIFQRDRLLLASNKRFKSGFYSVLAGFVEPGETLEECVAREVKEEVGLSVKNIRYFGSQPWPFPNSLMVGFLADYSGGDIKANPAEIADAAWFTADNLPAIPPRITIARHLIDWFVDQRPPAETGG